MRYPIETYYRRYGIRRKEELTRPRLAPITLWNLPQRSVVHYMPFDAVSLGPSEQDALIQGVEGRFFIEHITQLTGREGGPRPTAVSASVLVNEYRRRHRFFKRLTKDDALLVNPRSVLIENYAPLLKLNRYINSLRKPYYRWQNLAKTQWDNVAAVDGRFGYNQFLELTLPERIPSLRDFRLLHSRVNEKSLQAFDTHAALDLYDLWLWLGEEREESHLNVVPDDALSRVFFVVRLPGYFFVFSLGQIDQWRRDDDDDQPSGIRASVLQRRFVRLLHGLQDLVSGTTQVEVPVSEQTPSTTPDTPEETTDSPSEVSSPALDNETTTDAFSLSDLDVEFPQLPDPVSPPPSTDLSFDVTTDNDGEVTTTLPDADYGDDDEEVIHDDNQGDYTHAISRMAEQYAGVGMMSPGAANRAIRDGQTYQHLPDPFGSDQTLEEAMRITTDDVKMPPPETYPDRDTIMDKSMLQSSVSDYHKHYLNRLMQKDVLNAVMGVQNQGVAVKDYRIETVEDTMNHYQVHVVTLKPVRGKQSTVRFRLPVVQENGEFRYNGNTYRQRMQRADKTSF